ncbi:hypothetical protein SLS64_002537 [Diaporthe eres]
MFKFTPHFVSAALLLAGSLPTVLSQDAPTVTVLNGTYAGNDATRVAALGFNHSEDCLTLNVYRPAGYTDQLLPVGVYIYGGGYYMGSSADPRTNMTYIVQNSVEAGVPILTVIFNYRVSTFGFLGGSEIVEAGAANLGFRDQRLALHWIQENIAAFGGDPDRVTIFGNSAGAISQSGAPYGFSAVEPFLDGDFFVDTPARQLSSGNFVKVPYLLGHNTDEGTAFIPGNNFDNATFYPTSQINTDDEFLAYATELGFNSSSAATIASLYAQNATDQVIETYPNDLGAELGYQYKRACTLAGDYTIIAPTRYTAQIWASNGLPVYKYRWNNIVSGIPRYIGATHAKEIAYVYDDQKGWDYDVNPWLNKPQAFPDSAHTLSTAWVAFIATSDPNLGGTGMFSLRR